MQHKKILIVVGTRPNFIKVTQFRRVADLHPALELKIVHTGQHYDRNMAEVFFEQFDLKPDYFLDLKATAPIEQMSEIMTSLSHLITNTFTPDLLIVVGDVNSTMAAAIVANKLNIKLAHLESGLRSFDRSMPEEHNRIVTDLLADYFFITEQSGYDHLIAEGKNKDQLFFVGNTMIDTMVAFENKIQESDIEEKFELAGENYVLITIHRPSNVDNKEGLEKLFSLIEYISANNKIIFPIHPRTTKRMKEFNLYDAFADHASLILCEPLDYFAFQKLIANCSYVLTDSGGIQEETTFRKKPCLTIRPNTERPSTIDIGTNTLVEWDFDLIKKYIDEIETGNYKKGDIPKYWDGKSTERILDIIAGL